MTTYNVGSCPFEARQTTTSGGDKAKGVIKCKSIMTVTTSAQMQMQMQIVVVVIKLILHLVKFFFPILNQ